MRLEGLKICVTGGMGYIGSHTCKVLTSAGAEVVSVDNRIVEQNRLDGVQYLRGDYGSINILSILRTEGCDGIVHCAGTSLVGPSVLSPTEYYNNNVVKTIAMLDHFKAWERKPFVVFGSSAAVYGNPTELPISVLSHMDPVSPYGNTKMMIELILEDYDRAYGIKNYSFRYFNAVGADIWDSELGPEPGDTHIIPKLFEAYYNDQVFKLYDGSCIRDYIHVCDVALAHLRACVELSEGQSSAVFNLGTGSGCTNQEVLDIFTDLVGNVDVLVKESRESDPKALVADASLYYNSSTPAYSDMKTIIESYKDYYEKHK